MITTQKDDCLRKSIITSLKMKMSLKSSVENCYSLLKNNIFVRSLNKNLKDMYEKLNALWRVYRDGN